LVVTADTEDRQQQFGSPDPLPAQGHVIPALPREEASPALVNRRQLEIAGHHLTLFEESPPLIEAMVREIAAARSRVWVESYIFAADASGRAVAAALIERARAGLDVRLMYDAFGCFDTPPVFFETLRDAGVRVHEFHPLADSLAGNRFFEVFNQRNHRKLLIIDDHIAYFGGMNIVDQRTIQTVADVEAQHLPASAGWRDLHVRIIGPQQAQIAAAFERLWGRVHHERSRHWPRWPIKQMLNTPAETISFFDSRPAWRFRRPQRVLVPLIRKARCSITVSMAYFIPIGSILDELVRASQRGVKIRVVIPGESDVKAVQWATRHFYDYLLSRGIRIFERKNQMLHSKAIVIDDEWTIIGSCNLDPRSLRWNLEFLAVIRARSFAKLVTGICRYEIRRSRRVTRADCQRRGWWQRTIDRIAWSFRRWL
jgi:cardiolipin synthase